MTTFNKISAKPENNYFDLLDYIVDCKSAYIAAEMASSTAWRIDAALVSYSRALLKHIKDELFQRGGYETMSEIQIAFADASFAEQNFHEIGSNAIGPIELIRALNAQRDQWHDLAALMVPTVNDYRGMPMAYEIPSIDEVFFRENNIRTSETTSRRLKVRSERLSHALGMPELAEQHYKRELQKKEDDNVRIASLLKEQAPIALMMFNLALRSDDFGAEHASSGLDRSAALRPKAFYELPIEGQQLLLDNAINAASRADVRATSDRNMNEMEYDLISLTAIKVMTDLRNVLKGERFKVETATQV